MNYDDKIKELNLRLEQLSHKHNLFLKEIRSLRQEIHELQNQQIKAKKSDNPPIIPVVDNIDLEQSINKKVDEQLNEDVDKQPIITTKQPLPNFEETAKKIQLPINLEQFIGENLIAKVGILITIIGVIIGAKYSIDNNLINPSTRIIIGYLFGAGLLGFGIKLKSKYENYSAILVSGAIAIMYFLTYAAYSFYDLLPQLVAFAMMVLFTISTVIAAINYDKPIIAHIGLVGAYAVPFFLSDGSGEMQTFFIYVAIINIGILIISFIKYWKSIYYVAFSFTWLIYLFWFFSQYQYEWTKNFEVAVSFASIFFVIFYITFLAYKVVKKDILNSVDALLIFLNSFIYYGVIYTTLEHFDSTQNLLGLFTIGNAIIHGLVCLLIFKQKIYDKKLFYLIFSLVLVFVTIAIPVQLDGNWVTLLWTIEAALLFWAGRTKAIPFYEKMAFALMILAFGSIIQDWGNAYYISYRYAEIPTDIITPLFNINFLTSILFIAAFGWINIVNRDINYTAAFANKKRWLGIINFLIPTVFFIAIYIAFKVEITHYFEQLSATSRLTLDTGDSEYKNYEYNADLGSFKAIWTINYTLVFLVMLAFTNIKKLKNINLGFINLALSIITIAVFLIQGMYEFNELQNYYLDWNPQEDSFDKSSFYIIIRYLSYVFLGMLIFAIYKYTKADFMKIKSPIPFDFILYFSILAVISSEFLIWIGIINPAESTKLGLSIIWGIYSLIIIGLGIWKKKKHLRIGAILLFGMTLVKLFLYDISHLETIAKTIILVVLGVLLLIISFLYNKYKDLIFDEESEL
ncbi:MAG: DUF2339 domain-containing protein [Saprospiraceae bacterium]